MKKVIFAVYAVSLVGYFGLMYHEYKTYFRKS